jgi:hypothetical protein
MAARLWILCGVLAVIVLAGCGGASHKRVAPLAPALRGVVGRYLAAGELSGFTPGRVITSYGRADELPESKQPQELARLKSLGFVAALRERLVPPKGGEAQGLSVVEQFRSPRGARTELAAQVQLLTAHRRRAAFAVPAIPGARGSSGRGPRSGYTDVLFTKGSYYYLVGAGWPTGDRAAPTRATMIAAARRLYRRLRP